MEESKQEDWEVQTTFNEEDVTPILDEGGDIDEASNNDTEQGE